MRPMFINLNTNGLITNVFDDSIITINKFSPLMNSTKHANVYYMFDTFVLHCSKKHYTLLVIMQYEMNATLKHATKVDIHHF